MHIERGLHFSCSLRFEIRVYKQHDPLFILLSLRLFFISSLSPFLPLCLTPVLVLQLPVIQYNISICKNVLNGMTWKLLWMQMTAKIDENCILPLCNANNNTPFYQFNVQITWRSLEFQLLVYFMLCVCSFFYLVSFGLFAFENVVVLALFHFEAHLEQFWWANFFCCCYYCLFVTQ